MTRTDLLKLIEKEVEKAVSEPIKEPIKERVPIPSNPVFNPVLKNETEIDDYLFRAGNKKNN